MEQWYGKVPAAWNVNENRPFGARVPESNPLTFEVEVWEIESVFVQVTVVPAATVSSPGVYAPLPSELAPTGIVTDEAGAPVVGMGDGIGDGEAGDGEPLLPQADANTREANRRARRVDKIESSGHEFRKQWCRECRAAAPPLAARCFRIT